MFSPDAGRARPPFLIAMIVALIALGINHYNLVRPIPVPTPRPTQAPVPPPHFALDDIDLGPTVHITRFYPDFDIYPNNAVEGSDGNLYVAYYPNRPPWTWGFTGGEASRIGILDHGHIRPLNITRDDAEKEMHPGRMGIDGLYDGLPVVRINDGPAPRLVTLDNGAVMPFVGRPEQIFQGGPCIEFNGGTVCSKSEAYREVVLISLPHQSPILVVSATYLVDRSTVTKAGLHLKWKATEVGDVRLEGGGRHHFLLLEYHFGQNAAECLEADAN
jgi:hypothetical protein